MQHKYEFYLNDELNTSASQDEILMFEVYHAKNNEEQEDEPLKPEYVALEPIYATLENPIRFEYTF